MIRINKNKIYYHSHDRRKKPRIILDENIIYYLADEVKFDKTVTFKRIFDLIVQHKEMLNIIFYKTLGGYKIDDYLDDYNSEVDESTDIEFLEIYWHSEYFEFSNCDKEVSLCPSFHGIDTDFTDENQKEPCVMGIGLDFVNLSKLKDIKFKLNNEAKFNGYHPSKKTIEEKFPLLMEGNTYFKLFDVFEAILNEISFFGSPEDRDEKRKELDDTIERIKDGTEKMYEMKLENGKYNFYDTKTGELHDSWGDDSKDCGGSCGCSGSCECLDDE